MINEHYKDRGIANFISNNLAYQEEDDHKTVKWCVNLDAIVNNIDSLVGYPTFAADKPKYEGPSYFLNGSLSVKYDDDVYRSEFPNAKISTIDGAGHYVHIDKG